MSLPTHTEMKCPRCGHTYGITVWQTVNVTLDPALRMKVLDGSIRLTTCPQCQQQIRYEADLIYHDMDRSFMVSLIRSEPGKPFTAPTAILDVSNKLMTDYRLRFVTSYNQLREKILIFEAGLSDYAIETLKLVALVHKLPLEKINDDTAYFSMLQTDKSGTALIVFEVFDGTKYLGQLPIPRYLYDTSIESAGEDAVRGHEVGEWKLVNQSMFPRP